MKTTVSVYNFRDAFRSMGRENFSYAGLTAIFDYLEELEQSTGEELELDVIAVCCDFAEETIAEIAANYDIDLTDFEEEEEQKTAVLEYLEHHTQIVADLDDSIVYVQF